MQGDNFDKAKPVKLKLAGIALCGHRQGLPICPLSLFGVPVKADSIKLTQEATLRLFE